MAAYCEYKKLPGDLCQCIHCGQTFQNINCDTLTCICNQQDYEADIKRREIEYTNYFKEIEGPGKFKRFINFSRSLFKFLKSGAATCTKEEIKQRFKICSKCDYFNGETCMHADCGCNIIDGTQFINKLAWASEECPLKKWLALNKSSNI